MTATEKILDYFKENEDTFADCVEQLDSWNGYLGDDRFYEMYELDEVYRDTDPTELLSRAYFGYDEDSYTTDAYGQEHHDAFNPNREYFRFNGYGNLVSSDYKDYSDHLDSYVVEALSEARCHINVIDDDPELSELFDSLEEENA